jgi:hypothetical protein
MAKLLEKAACTWTMAVDGSLCKPQPPATRPSKEKIVELIGWTGMAYLNYYFYCYLRVYLSFIYPTAVGHAYSLRIPIAYALRIPGGQLGPTGANKAEATS